MAIREGKWDCTQCGHKGVRGGETRCPNCGKLRAKDVQFYVEEDAGEVTDEAALAKANAGADWLCEFCEASNPAALMVCKSCGAPPSGERRFEKVTLTPEELEAQKAAAAAAIVPPKKKRGWMPWAVGALALFGACLFICAPSEKKLQLKDLSWQRSITVEKFATVTESDWQSDMPSGARTLSCESKLHHTEKVKVGEHEVTHTVSEKVQVGTKKKKVGTKDKGNGYFEDVYKDEPVYETREKEVRETEPVYKDDPVYRQHCRYEIDKWVADHVEKAEGHDKSPKWPEVRLGGGQKREGAREEKYKAVFADPKGKTYDWDAPAAKWQKLELGKDYNVSVSLGSVSDLVDDR